jgi:phage replication initiation protein
MAAKKQKITRPHTLAEVDALVERSRQVFSDKAAAQATERGTSEALVPQAPATNRGGKSLDTWIAARLVMEDGTPLEIPARRGWGGQAAFIDWLNFTCHEDAFAVRSQGITDEDVMIEVSYICESIFGFGITEKREIGANFYRRSYVLGAGLGMVCHGGQRDTG